MAQYVSLVPDCNMVDACPHCTNANQKNVRWSNTYPHVSTQDRYPNRSISCNLTCFSGTLQLLEDKSSWCCWWCWCCCCPAGGPAGACTSSAAAACKAWWRAHGTGGEISSRQLRARSLPAWQEQQHTRRLGPTLVPPCMDVPEVPPQAKESFAVNSPVAVGGWGSRSKEVAAGGAGGPPAGVDAVQREGRRERVELREQPPAKPGGTRMAQYVSLVPDCNMVDACPHCTNANQKNVRWSNTYPHVSTQDRYPNRSISCNLTCFSGTLQLLEDKSSWCWCWCC